MNLLWDIQAKTYDSAATYTREAAARHRMLRTPERRQIAAPVVKPVVVALKEEPVRARDQSPKDAHVLAYYAWRIEGHGSPCKAYIMRRSTELGFSYAEVTGSRCTKEVIRARHTIMWEIKRTQKPGMSYPELGRLFGRDHTSVIHAVKKMDAVMGWGE